MKRSIRYQYHILIIIMLILVFLQSILLLVTIGNSKQTGSLTNNLQTIVIVFIFLIFVYAIVIFNYIPNRLKKSLSGVSSLINEISHGNYQFEINKDQYDGDKNIQNLLLDLQKMLVILQRFDQSKADKIFEHHQRLLLLINLVPQGAIITMVNGEIKYCNDAMRKLYPALSEEVNINEIMFKTDLDKMIFGKISDALRYGNNLYDYKIPDQNYLKQVVINGSMVRNRKGIATGGIFLLSFTENVKQD